MGVVEAFVVGALAGVYVIAGCIGFANCDVYQKWKAEQEAKQEDAVIYTFAPDGAEVPEGLEGCEIVIVASGE